MSLRRRWLDRVAGVPRRASVDGAEAILDGHVRGRAQLAHAGDEVLRVVALVGADAHASAAPGALLAQQPQTGLALGRATGLRELALEDQAVAVLDQAVPGVAEPGLLAAPLAREARLGVGRRAVRLVAAALAMEVDVGVTPAAGGRLLAFVLSRWVAGS